MDGASRNKMETEFHSTPRRPCPDCARKHLAQAVVLLQESVQGYPDHRWLAIGNMAEAEAEIMGMFEDVAGDIREARKAMESNRDLVPDLMPFISDISYRVDKYGGGGCGCGCSINRSASTGTRRGRNTSVARTLRRTT